MVVSHASVVASVDVLLKVVPLPKALELLQLMTEIPGDPKFRQYIVEVQKELRKRPLP